MKLMSGISNSCLQSLRHDVSTSWQAEHASQLFHHLWYSTTAQAYIQRSTLFDNSVFALNSGSYKRVIDQCLVVLLSLCLQLDQIKTNMNSTMELESFVRDARDCDDVLFLRYDESKNSLLPAFHEKVRNAIAHGTFNRLADGRYLFVGQNKAKQESPVNFFMRIGGLDLIDSFNNTVDELVGADVFEVIKQTYNTVYPLDSVSKNLFQRRSDGAYLLIDSSFEFASVDIGGQQEAQVRNRLENMVSTDILNGNRQLFYVIPESTNSTFAKIASEYPSISIVTKDCLAEHLGVRNLSTKQEKLAIGGFEG